MHIITVSVTVSLIKIQQGLLTELEKKINKKKKILRKTIIFFWVGPVSGG